MVSDSFFLEVTKQSGTKLLLQTVAIKPKETLQPIPTEEERGERREETPLAMHVDRGCVPHIFESGAVRAFLRHNQTCIHVEHLLEPKI